MIETSSSKSVPIVMHWNAFCSIDRFNETNHRLGVDHLNNLMILWKIWWRIYCLVQLGYFEDFRNWSSSGIWLMSSVIECYWVIWNSVPVGSLIFGIQHYGNIELINFLPNKRKKLNKYHKITNGEEGTVHLKSSCPIVDRAWTWFIFYVSW